ncbi:hypothetical protein GCM10010172_63690 [Paractinoplanes ferrugineus]|uniref:non-specific serine/threonine protein kinase n=1 Tax=Paractinoplanes ferrugineus TaxID=113564 RepID=A0A919JAD1_9ACTN|nr:hypothetical protein Afe05nite_82790 [Actinoplanes ferrugineus]
MAEDDSLLGGRYRLLRPTGAGGMAVVWEARDDVLARTVAVKVLAGDTATDPDARQRIRREAQAAAAIAHPNIAQVHDYGETGEQPYVVMEFVPGGTLLQRMGRGLLPPRFALRVGAEVAAALAAAHAEGLVHRDVKPANVMLAPTGAKVVDFGIAAAIAPAGLGADGDMLYGTPAYLAPERLLDDAVSPASDVYALGVLLYLMLTGRSPWSIEDTTEMLSAHIYLEPPPLPTVPGVPDYVTDLGNRCLQKDPTTRPSAREAAALLATGAGLPTVVDDPAVPATGAVPFLADFEPVTDPIHEPGFPPSTATAHAAAGFPPPATTTHPDPGFPPPVTGATGNGGFPPAPAGTPASERRRNRLVAVSAGAAALAAMAVWLLLPDDKAAAPSAGPVSAAPPGAGPSSPGPANPGPTPKTAVTGTAPADPADPAANLPPAAGLPPATAAPARTGTAPAPAGTAPAGAGPTGTAPAPPKTTAPEPPAGPAPERTFTSDAGEVSASCSGTSTARILSWTAAKPYKVDETDPGPGARPSVRFKHGNRFVTMTVACASGVPSLASE